MQSISHFSYHASGGNSLLCDLQGGIYSNGVVLTDPVVMSRKQLYGPTDLGSGGIETFFARHVCNQYCRGAWSKPRQPHAHFEEKKGTSMMMVLTRNSRQPLSRQVFSGYAAMR